MAGNGFCVIDGTRLAALLNDGIDALVTDQRSRADIIQEMADAANISPGTVNQILTASINCPPRSRLEGFATVLEISVSAMITAAEDDGCDYGSP